MEFLEKAIWLPISLILIFLGLYMLVAILLASFNPYDNIAFANTEKLRSAINEACIKNGPVYMNGFELRQNTLLPAYVRLLPAGIGEYFPKVMMSVNGDPYYVLYYEAFPPGDAVGWEVYQDHQYRLLTPLIDGFESNTRYKDPLNGVENYAEDQLKRFLQEKPNSKADAVLINNIILSEGFNPKFIAFQETSGIFGLGGRSGSAVVDRFQFGGPLPSKPNQFDKWRNSDSSGNPFAGDNVFLFYNYAGMSIVQKSLVKYIPCGENSLCLKTTKGVYRFPLSECNDIKNVQMIYDARAGVATRTLIVAGTAGAAVATVKIAPALLTVGGSLVRLVPTFTAKVGVVVLEATGVTTVVYFGAKEIAQYLGTAFLAFKTSDLNLASPCVIRSDADQKAIKIEKRSCAKIELPGPNPSHCTAVASYPLYRYDRDKGFVRSNKEHYTCIEKIANDDVIDKINPKIPYNNDDQCIQITINTKAVGCWTPDPYKDDIIVSDTQAFTAILGLTPVKDSLDYTKGSGSLDEIIILRPSDEENLNKFLSTWERKLVWGWPWDFDG